MLTALDVGGAGVRGAALPAAVAGDPAVHPGRPALLLVHATPRDPLDEYLLKDPTTWSKRLHNVDADIVCVGHTHFQFNIQVNGVTVLNPGSVGLPRDGDPRAAFAVIEDNKILLKRVEYPVETTVARVESMPWPRRAKDITTCVLRLGRLPAHLDQEEPSSAPTTSWTQPKTRSCRRYLGELDSGCRRWVRRINGTRPWRHAPAVDQFSLDPVNRDAPAPAGLDGGPGVPEPLTEVLQLLDQGEQRSPAPGPGKDGVRGVPVSGWTLVSISVVQ